MTTPYDKVKKARERAARRERRKLERLRLELEQTGELSDWEAEFSESVAERLDEYGAAFHDPEKGKMSEALSYAQKKIMADMRKKLRQNNSAKTHGNDSQQETGEAALKTSAKALHTVKPMKPVNEDGAEASFPSIEKPRIDAPHKSVKQVSDKALQRPFLHIVVDNDEDTSP